MVVAILDGNAQRFSTLTAKTIRALSEGFGPNVDKEKD